MKKTILLFCVAASTFLAATAQHTPTEEVTSQGNEAPEEEPVSKEKALEDLRNQAFDLIDQARNENNEDAASKAYDLVEGIYNELKLCLDADTKQQAEAQKELQKRKTEDNKRLKTLNADIDKQQKEYNDLKAKLAAFKANPNQDVKAEKQSLEGKIKVCEDEFLRFIKEFVKACDTSSETRVRCVKTACALMGDRLDARLKKQVDDLVGVYAVKTK